jgi:hypothetical protein
MPAVGWQLDGTGGRALHHEHGDRLPLVTKPRFPKQQISRVPVRRYSSICAARTGSPLAIISMDGSAPEPLGREPVGH